MDEAGHLPLTGLEWNQPSMFNRHFELMLGEERLATLAFQKVFGTLALAEWGPTQWEFERSGFLHHRVIVRRAGADDEVAHYQPHWAGRRGVLHGPGARERQFFTTGLLATEYSWKDEQGQVLLTFRTRGVMRTGAELAVTEAGADDDDIVLLILAGWYLVQLARADSSAAVVAAT